MMNRTHWAMLGLTAAVLLDFGCGIFTVEDEPDGSDGDLCSSDDDCVDGVCTTASLCSHSACDCPSGSCAPGGEQTDACRDGWVCVGYDSIVDPVVDVFGGEPNERDGYCMPLCEPGCPEHYVCDGELCSPDEYWAYPIPTVTWAGAATGELSGPEATIDVVVEGGSTIALEGFAESPSNTELIGLSWTTVSQAGDTVELEGSLVEITVPEGSGSYRRVELFATDVMARVGHLTVIFESCLGAGTTCGDQGSGCCTSCDDASSTCS